MAIKSGRIPERLVIRSPRGKIQGLVDGAEVLEVLAATTLEDRRPLTGPTAARAAEGAPRPVSELATWRAQREKAQAELAEIELAEKRGELVPAREVEARMVEVFAHCRTKLLGVPARARQQDPSLTAAQVRMLDELVREALEELAGEGTDGTDAG